MRIAFDGKQFLGSYITGPSHCYLGLTLVPDASVDWSLEERTLKDEARILSPSEVRAWINDGVAEGNAEFSENFGVARGEFVISDSARPEIYAHIAKSMVAAARGSIALVASTCRSVGARAGTPIQPMTFMNSAKGAGHQSGDVVDALEYCRSLGWIESGDGGSIVLTKSGAERFD